MLPPGARDAAPSLIQGTASQQLLQGTCLHPHTSSQRGCPQPSPPSTALPSRRVARAPWQDIARPSPPSPSCSPSPRLGQSCLSRGRWALSRTWVIIWLREVCSPQETNHRETRLSPATEPSEAEAPCPCQCPEGCPEGVSARHDPSLTPARRPHGQPHRAPPRLQQNSALTVR